jgi:hypothetical protein
MNLKDLSKKELFNLKGEIDGRLEKIAEQEKRELAKKKKKDRLLDLKGGDMIFGIRLSAGPHRLAEPKELNCEVDIADYCKVKGNDIRTSGEYEGTFRLDISYEHGAFGIGTTLDTERDGDKHCLLTMGTSNSGYDGFYTLKPETWKEDLLKAFDEKIELRNKYYQEELSKYHKKLEFFLAGEKKINEIVK